MEIDAIWKVMDKRFYHRIGYKFPCYASNVFIDGYYGTLCPKCV